MALLLNSPHTKRPRPHLLLHSLPHQHPTPLRSFTIKFQDPSSSSDKSTEDTSSSSTVGKKDSSSSLGFGSSVTSSKKKQQKGKRERDSIIRREPIQKPSFATQPDESGSKEFQKNESAFLLAWLGLGGIILVEGILLAASGFLPEAWDNFFVKYLYPSFTPTVFLFVAGTVAYGVLKYLQNEKFNSEN
ncbi:hypothetical protein RND71_018680 [Anisodus tanguticus]|uniref:Protein LOW PSII ACCUMULATION 2, chloroplastic n=1 Tax=Anisodus tanguticus TaxID=243964 RepID=A0AAE1S5U6_9SOLA|nr:hypothetical protein RND71_018680 [Anisodus tanguticus]